ncbi:hypothetical protein V5O48_003124 [Marasmius crinis-equi]|uniref:Piwi domain-containing protein n=1 Tax=Marasmius crinis-equi TaxID=585013 RepID=A0ABR3FTS9_9AGAR
MAPRSSRSGSSQPRGGPLQAERGNQPASVRGAVQVGSQPANVVATVGVKRPGHGTAGRKIKLLTNACPIGIPQTLIHHYDVIAPTKDYPRPLALKLIDRLQRVTEPDLFKPLGVYDGKKNLFMPHNLDFGKDDSGKPIVSKSFDVAMPKADPAKPPTVYRITLSKAAVVNPEVLKRFVEGKQSEDEAVSTVVMVMNIVLGQEPKSKYPATSRSFFPGEVRKSVGHGLELQRGYFQSVRPAIGRVILNFDITTGLFYKSGTLIDVALDFFGLTDVRMLAPSNGLQGRHRHDLDMFVSGMIVKVWTADKKRQRSMRVEKLSMVGADEFTFDWKDHGETSVADYFRRSQNEALRFPKLICVITPRGETIPIEKCEVPEGQIARKQAPEPVVAEMVKFSQKRPDERMDAVKNGLNFIGHVQSEYVKNFGMTVNTEQLPMKIDARVLVPPKLEYGKGGKQVQVEPKLGSWNMMDTKLVDPKAIKRWALVILDQKGGRFGFGDEHAKTVVSDLTKWFGSVGMTVGPNILTHWGNGQQVSRELHFTVNEFKKILIRSNPKGDPAQVPEPDLIVVVLPDANNKAMYDEVKLFGDVQTGIPTQCLKASKCKRAKPDYWVNTALKANLKLGGIDVKPDASAMAAGGLCDPRAPTIVMGADVIHPPPRSTAPSYAAVVANVDSNVSKYVADTRMQESRVEIIDDLGGMVKRMLNDYMGFHMQMEGKTGTAAVPARLLFFRDGVSSGQYQEVKDRELQLIKDACKELNINPKITFIIVAKRHHFRFSPEPNAPRNNVDRSGNTVAGTVVDRDIVHPVEFDFYIQSHGGLLGTSRSAHYHVLHDDNKFSADGLQSLCYTLCHLFARSTKSITVPAPVAYADIACTRARASHHEGDFQPVHPKQARRTYFA